MVKCSNCKSDDYEVVYIEDYSYNGSEILLLAKAKCCECGEEFWIRENFTFDTATNVL